MLGNKRGALWVSRADLEGGQLSTDDSHGCASSLLGKRPLVVIRQENRADSKGATLEEEFTRADSKGATLEEKFTRADSKGATLEERFTECIRWRKLRWTSFLGRSFGGNSEAEIRGVSSTRRNLQSVLTERGHQGQLWRHRSNRFSNSLRRARESSLARMRPTDTHSSS
jgi:hypothetical protein